MNLNKESVVHMNRHYQVVYIPPAERHVARDVNGFEVEWNFEVRSIQYETVEFGCDCLPLCLSMAESWDYNLTNRTYISDPDDILDAMSSSGFSEEDDESGGKLQ